MRRGARGEERNKKKSNLETEERRRQERRCCGNPPSVVFTLASCCHCSHFLSPEERLIPQLSHPTILPFVFIPPSRSAAYMHTGRYLLYFCLKLCVMSWRSYIDHIYIKFDHSLAWISVMFTNQMEWDNTLNKAHPSRYLIFPSCTYILTPCSPCFCFPSYFFLLSFPSFSCGFLSVL